MKTGHLWQQNAALALAGIVFAGALSGAVWEKLAARRDLRSYPPPGRMVIVDGHALHMMCSGAGQPTVILEAGIEESSLVWYLVQPQVAKFARVCAVDRPGLGWSESAAPPRTAQRMASELSAQLQRAEIAGPYVLVAHSFGAFIVRLYARRYPSKVAGIVLVDGENEDTFARFFPELKRHPRKRALRLLLTSASSFFGIPRLLGECGQGPLPITGALKATECHPSFFYDAGLEWLAWNQTAEEVRRAGSLGDLPLVVISSDPRRNSLGHPWDEAQVELASLSTRSSRLIAEGSGHMIPYERPDLVTAVIRQLVDSRGPAGITAVASK